MFVLPGLLALIVFIYLRPLDFIPQLRQVPLLYVFFGLAVFGFVVDARQGKLKFSRPPHGIWALGFYVWAMFTGAVMGPDSLAKTGLNLTIAVAIYALIALGTPSFKAFECLAATLLICSIIIAAICVHQGFQPLQCVVMPPGELGSFGRPDGRLCDTIDSCFIDAPERGLSYRCEHVGWLGTTSVAHGRVRYIGVLQDPNETSMAVAIGVPFAFAFFQRKRTLLRFCIVVLTLMLASFLVVMSKSRGGQLVFMAVLGVYFLKRYRLKGLLLAGVAALPVLAMGGRSGEKADASKFERIDNLMAGIDMFIHSPILGVGLGRFTQYHFRTAHNAYLLAPAELGLLGMVTWTSVLFVSIKSSYRAATLEVGPEGEVARTWGLAMLAAFVGLSIGIFFLSFNYHFVFWIYTGLAGALAGAILRHSPTFRTDLSPKEVGLITFFGLALLVVIFGYAKYTLR